jgi:hypothetical protein
MVKIKNGFQIWTQGGLFTGHIHGLNINITIKLFCLYIFSIFKAKIITNPGNKILLYDYSIYGVGKFFFKNNFAIEILS